LYTLVNKAQPNEYRYKQIDSLRGIAALLVIWLHVSELYINLSPQVKIAGSFFYDFPWHINTGLIGVNIFFAISGFVLLKSIKGPKRAATKLFFTRRFFRLYPAFWLSVLLGYYVMSLMGKHFSAGEIIANLTMLPQLLHHKVILGLYWTLQIEIIFYFIAWLMFIFDKLHNPLHLFLSSIFFLTIYITSKILIYFNVQQIESMITPFCLAIMFWGGMFRQLYDTPESTIRIFSKNISIKLLFSILTIAILFFPFITLIRGIIVNTYFPYIQEAIANISGIVLFLILAKYLKIKQPFFVWLGTISYSMYLFHPVIFYFIYWCLINYAHPSLLDLHLSVYLFINIIVIILFSSLTYLLVEKPAIKYSHHLSYIKNQSP